MAYSIDDGETIDISPLFHDQDGAREVLHHQRSAARAASDIIIDGSIDGLNDEDSNKTITDANTGIPGNNSRKILNEIHLLRRRSISTNQRIRREFEYMSEDKISRQKLEEVHCSLPSSMKSTFIMTFSPDGKRVASTHGDHRLYICDLNTGKLLDTLEGHPKTPWCLAWHPSNNDILASGCLAGQVKVWDLKTKACESWTNSASSNNHNNIITSLDFHPKDRVLVIATANSVMFWDWSEAEPFARVDTSHQRENVKFVVFDSSGTKLITGISNLPKYAGYNDSLQHRIIDSYLTQNLDQPTSDNMTQTSETSPLTNSTNLNQSNVHDTADMSRNDIIPGPSAGTGSSTNQTKKSIQAGQHVNPSTSQAGAGTPTTTSLSSSKRKELTDTSGPDSVSKKKRTVSNARVGRSTFLSAFNRGDLNSNENGEMIDNNETTAVTSVASSNPNQIGNSIRSVNGQSRASGHHEANLSGVTTESLPGDRLLVSWNNTPNQSVEQSLQRIIAAAAANIQHTILVKIYHRSNGSNGNSNNQSGGSPSDNPTIAHSYERPTAESRRRALSQDHLTLGASTNPPPVAELPSFLLPNNIGQMASEPDQSLRHHIRRPAHGVLPVPNSAAHPANIQANESGMNRNLHNHNSLNGPGINYSGNGFNNYESWPRNPHVHVYQTRGTGPHLWFNHWTIPLPAHQSNYRLQCWKFSLSNIPNIKDSHSNIVTQKCRIHNASSIDLSSDGSLIACLVPRDEMHTTNFDLKIFSILTHNLGTCLYQIFHGPNAVSVSLSPSANYAVVGLKSSRFICNDPTDDYITIAKVFKLVNNVPNSNANDGSNKDDKFDSVDDSIGFIRDIKVKRVDTPINLNIIKWMPHGIVYNVGPQHCARPSRVARAARAV